MQATAVGLVLLSAVAHVYWNYQVKRSPEPAVYTWWLMAIGAALFAPFALWIAWPLSVPAAGWYCVAGTGLFYAGYYSFMARSYDREELSRAYPIARGVAPIATAAWGVLFHHEHPSLAGWLGIGGISLGVFALAVPRLFSGKKAVPLAGILAAVATGLCVSGYSAIDKEGVKHVHPALYIVLTFAAGALAQGVLVWPRRGWRKLALAARREGAGLWLAAAVALGGYLLILIVLRTAALSYVVPLRSVSVLLSVFTGARFLGETAGTLRLVGAFLIVAGIAAIALAG